MRIKSIVKLFDKGNVSVCGLRGTGKDMLFANVIERRHKPYISNCDYHCSNSSFIKLDFSKIDLDNNYTQLLNGDIIPYDYPYPEGADIYISDIHPCMLLDMIEGKAFTPGYRERLRTIPDTVSAFKVFIKVKPGTIPFCDHPVSILDKMSNAWNLSAHDSEGWPHGVSCFMAPSADGRWATHISVLSLMSWDEVSRWADTVTGHRTPEYEEWKAARTEKVLDMVERIIPDIRSRVEDCFAASPLTFRDWLGTKEGSIYGYFKDTENLILSQLPIRTKVENLLLTGQNVNMHGIGGVPMTAIETAETIVGRDCIVKKIKKLI